MPCFPSIPEELENFTVRHCIEADWLNDRDQFLWPSDSQEIGLRAEGEEEKDLRPVSTSDAKQTSLPLRSAETSRFNPLAGEPPAPPEPLAADGGVPYDGDAVSGRVAAMDAAESRIPVPAFSPAAQAVFEAGRALWRHYHAQPGAVPDAPLHNIP